MTTEFGAHNRELLDPELRAATIKCAEHGMSLRGIASVCRIRGGVPALQRWMHRGKHTEAEPYHTWFLEFDRARRRLEELGTMTVWRKIQSLAERDPDKLSIEETQFVVATITDWFPKDHGSRSFREFDQEITAEQYHREQGAQQGMLQLGIRAAVAGDAPALLDAMRAESSLIMRALAEAAVSPGPTPIDAPLLGAPKGGA